jgi:predicted nucleic acid-binding protein
MTLMVDTSVWSLALRRAAPAAGPEVTALREALAGARLVVTTGLILQELLQGFVPERSRERILEAFAEVPMIHPSRSDHVAAADLRNACRGAGVQLGTVDALIAQLCVRHSLTLLSADQDFAYAAPLCGLQLWSDRSRAQRLAEIAASAEATDSPFTAEERDRARRILRGDKDPGQEAGA